jgi:L-ascorbate metabolism protein UlaG (beta-lactamase superfamily)
MNPLKWLFLLSGIAGALAAQPARPVQEFDTKAGKVKITPIRHASVLIEAGGKAIHIDPNTPGNYEGLPKADLILITDIHGDHMDPKAIANIKGSSAQIIAPKAVAEKLNDSAVQTLDNGAKKTWEKWTIEAIPMYNLKRGPAEGKLYHDKGRGNGYVLTYGGKRFYFSGDTENIPEMRALKNIDVAFICMNLPYTMTPEEAAEAVRAFSPKVAIPYHYRGSDVNAFKTALANTKTEVRLIDWYY